MKRLLSKHITLLKTLMMLKIEKNSNLSSLLKRSPSECVHKQSQRYFYRIDENERKFTKVENVYFSPTHCSARIAGSEKIKRSLFKIAYSILFSERINHTH